jgi:hypothetical protein
MLPSLRISLGAFALLATGAAVACGSSSSSPNNAGDGGTGGDDGSVTTAGPDGGALINATCGLLGMVGGGGSMSCGSGMTCCTMLALPPSASCVPTGSCSGLSNECTKAADCATGQVCCGGTADAGPLVIPDAAPAGGIGGFGSFDTSQFATTCQTSCMGTQTQECAMDSECPSGQTCQSAGGAGGNPLAGFIMLPSVCMAPMPDAGTTSADTGTPPPDTGAPTPDADTADVAAGD